MTHDTWNEAEINMKIVSLARTHTFKTFSFFQCRLDLSMLQNDL